MLLSLSEAAKQLGVSPVRLRQLCQSGACGAKIGGVWLVSDEEVRQLAKRRKPGRPKKTP